MLDSMMRKMFGTKQDRDIRALRPTLDQINSLEKNISPCPMKNFRHRPLCSSSALTKGEEMSQILPDAFAVVREASTRVLKMRHFDVQILGGLVLNQGKISEMKTGEGKTLTATLPLYLERTLWSWSTPRNGQRLPRST